MNDTEIIEAMVKFMKQTNEILLRLGTEVNNLKVDVDKLKKHQTPRILLSGAMGNNYGINANRVGGNGEHKTS